jgi:cellobiose epimerase
MLTGKSSTLYTLILILASCSLLRTKGNTGAQNLDTLAKEMRLSLKNELLQPWYPRTIDSLYGGFLCDFTFDWQPDGPQEKMLVTQSRHIWTASKAAAFFNDSTYLAIAEHGYIFLRDKMWDTHYGGFFMLIDRKGNEVSHSYADTKTAYGNAFALYGLAGYFKQCGDSAVLKLAKKTFHWLDVHSHDSIHGGYFDQLMRNGSHYLNYESELEGMERERACWKDYNSSIHLLEAFTELYKVWPNELVKSRIIEMITLIRDTIVDEKGYLKLYFKPDWTPISYRDSTKLSRNENWYYDHVSFGHDVETAYLLIEAMEVINLENPQKTLEVARRLVDHALSVGWDTKKGGFYNMAYYVKGEDQIRIVSKSKVWWSQAEGLNALLLMAVLFHDNQYMLAFQQQWAYINACLIDSINGEWYMEGLDNSPAMKYKPKATMWKVNYHNSRALMNCIQTLEAWKD